MINYEQPNSIEPNAEMAVEKVKALYEYLGHERGAALVEANIVLTLAGARGQTEFFIDKPHILKNGELEEINKILKDDGIFLTSEEKYIYDSFQTIGVYSLPGLEYVSGKSKIPGVFAYDSDTGIDGARVWAAEVKKNIEKEKENGNLPANYDIDNIISGLARGYPDQAIYDATDAFSAKDKTKRSKLESSDITGIRLYRGAQPNYDFYKEHADNTEIIEHKKLWENILEQFYASSWHKAASNNPDFIEARKNLNLLHEESMKRKDAILKYDKKTTG